MSRILDHLRHLFGCRHKVTYRVIEEAEPLDMGWRILRQSEWCRRCGEKLGQWP